MIQNVDKKPQGSSEAKLSDNACLAGGKHGITRESVVVDGPPPSSNTHTSKLEQLEIPKSTQEMTTSKSCIDMKFSKALIFYNPISSSGKSLESAQETQTFLKKIGIECILVESSAKAGSYQQDSIKALLAESDLMIIAGGDGTTRKLLPIATAANIPIYMLPTGNESLFAGIYGMTRKVEEWYKILSEGQILEQHFGLINGEGINGYKPFFIMASMGLDSLTVQNIGKRSGRLNNIIYGIQGIKALSTLHFPLVSIAVDGKVICEEEKGSLIVANANAYARNLQLVPQATPDNDTLVLGFDNQANLGRELYKASKMAFKQPANLNMQYYTGKNIDITVHDSDYPIQVDGDFFRDRPLKKDQTLHLSIAPTTVKILTAQTS